MSYEDDSKYEYLPYVDRNLGRVYVPGDKENTKRFIKDFRESEFGSRLVSEGLATADHLDQILSETQRRFGHDDVNMTEFTQTAKSLWMAGDLVVEQEPVPQAPPAPQLTASQRAWQEFRVFTDSHSVAECKARARADEAYRKFLHTNLERELGDGTQVGDAVVAVGTQAVRQDKSIRITQELNDFAIAYRQMSAAEVRKNSTSATNPNAADFVRNTELAIAAGLL
jgi:hypothetical protein